MSWLNQMSHHSNQKACCCSVNWMVGAAGSGFGLLAFFRVAFGEAIGYDVSLSTVGITGVDKSAGGSNFSISARKASSSKDISASHPARMLFRGFNPSSYGGSASSTLVEDIVSIFLLLIFLSILRSISCSMSSHFVTVSVTFCDGVSHFVMTVSVADVSVSDMVSQIVTVSCWSRLVFACHSVSVSGITRTALVSPIGSILTSRDFSQAATMRLIVMRATLSFSPSLLIEPAKYPTLRTRRINLMKAKRAASDNSSYPSMRMFGTIVNCVRCGDSVARIAGAYSFISTVSFPTR